MQPSAGPGHVLVEQRLQQSGVVARRAPARIVGRVGQHNQAVQAGRLAQRRVDVGHPGRSAERRS
jgi:hypothetical protein